MLVNPITPNQKSIRTGKKVIELTSTIVEEDPYTS